jgi:hypothetical protein
VKRVVDKEDAVSFKSCPTQHLMHNFRTCTENVDDIGNEDLSRYLLEREQGPERELSLQHEPAAEPEQDHRADIDAEATRGLGQALCRKIE